MLRTFSTREEVLVSYLVETNNEKVNAFSYMNSTKFFPK